jgi:hypothetical protein
VDPKTRNRIMAGVLVLMLVVVAVAAATVVVPTSAMSWVDRTLQCTYMRVGSSSTKLGEPPGRRKWSCRATTSSHASLERLRKDSIVCLRDSAWMGFEM